MATARPARRLLPALVTITAAVLLTACGQASGPVSGAASTSAGVRATTGPPPTSPSSRTPTTSAAPRPGAAVARAAQTTRAAGTAAVDMETDLTVGGATSRITGEGALDFDAGTGELAFTFDDGSTVEQIVTPDAVYVRLPDTPDQWYEAPVDETGLTPLGTGDPAAALAALAGMGEVTQDGTEQIDGESTTRYVGTVAAADVLATSGLSGEQIDALGPRLDDAPGATVTVWVDGAGRVVQLQQELALDGGRLGEVASSALVRFADFGRPVEVSPPPGDQIVPAPEGLFGSRGGGAA